MKTIYFDECGYTGEDLLSNDQKTFVVASICLEELDCIELKQRFFGTIRAKELKHSLVQRRPKQQNCVFEFISFMKDSHKDCIKFGVMHKKFVLTSKIADLLIETIMREDGFDLYDKGGNIALSNLFFLYFPQMIGHNWFDSMLQKFQRMLRVRDIISYNDFFSMFDFYYNQKIEDLFMLIKAWDMKKGHRGLDELPKDSLCISFAELFTITHWWSRDLKEKFIITHDGSSPIAKEEKNWKKVVDPEIPEAVVGYDRRTFSFPILVNTLQFEPSMNWAGLQLADILAGAMARSLNWVIDGKNEDPYAKKLSEILCNGFNIHAVWPSANITPEELGTSGENAGDALEFITELLSK